MARIPDVLKFNTNEKRTENIKIKTAEDSTMLLTTAETKKMLLEFISDEINILGNEYANIRRREIEESIDRVLHQFEDTLLEHVSNKIDTITEKILSKITDRMIDAEVEKRVKERLKKYNE